MGWPVQTELAACGEARLSLSEWLETCLFLLTSRPRSPWLAMGPIRRRDLFMAVVVLLAILLATILLATTCFLFWGFVVIWRRCKWRSYRGLDNNNRFIMVNL